jgi:NAD(P)-dependent dehydrogenase (short-subunit alcohol dehydrogenase family)
MTERLKFALVTGAGSGIGRACAVALCHDGFAVALAGRRRQALEETAVLCSSVPDHTLILPADVADPEQVAALFDTITGTWGRLDVLFNNAGTGAPPVPFEDLTFEAWKRVVDVNLNGSFLCAQAAFRLMKAQDPKGGRIINNGSISAHTPRPLSSAYTSTKHAITGLTKSLALDGRAHEIAAGQIDIGNAGTPMTARMSTGALQPSGDLVAEPTMDVSAVADAVLYMANLPLSANVLSMTVMATKMPFVGRG